MKEIWFMILKVECKKAQPKEVMSPTGTARGRSRVMPYGMDAFMLGIGMLGELKKEIISVKLSIRASDDSLALPAVHCRKLHVCLRVCESRKHFLQNKHCKIHQITLITVQMGVFILFIFTMNHLAVPKANAIIMKNNDIK